jgi:hypothetical protein
MQEILKRIEHSDLFNELIIFNSEAVVALNLNLSGREALLNFGNHCYVGEA